MALLRLRALCRASCEPVLPACRRYDIDLREERHVALLRLRALCRAGFISVRDFQRNPLRIFAAHEVAALCGDGSLGTKMTVQFNLFGGSVLKLGTARHHGKFLDAIDMLDDVGCFGLTELGCALLNAIDMLDDALSLTRLICLMMSAALASPSSGALSRRVPRRDRCAG